MGTPLEQVPVPRQMRLRYAGTCVRCGKNLAKGQQAFYDSTSHTVYCVVCDPELQAPLVVDEPGRAGASAQREYERRSVARQARVRGALGNILGGVVLALTDEPQSTRAWARGALGERRLAEALGGLPGLKMLHDRRVPGTRGNIDHILVSPAGVFVVDAKLYKGRIATRDVGGFLRKDERLFVGSRDCSRLAENLRWQVEAVQRALKRVGSDPMPRVTPVLCFVDGDWPLLLPPTHYKDVRLEGTRSIKKLVAEQRFIDEGAVETIHHALALAFRPR